MHSQTSVSLLIFSTHTWFVHACIRVTIHSLLFLIAAMNMKLRDEYTFIIEEIQKVSHQSPSEMSDSAVHSAVSVSAAVAATAIDAASAAALEIDTLRREVESLRISAAASAASAVAADAARAEMERKLLILSSSLTFLPLK
jgi:hypothetical protein